MRCIAPAGTKITLSDIIKAFFNLIKSDDVLEDFRNAICKKFKVKHCFFWETGRTGMAFLLKSLYDRDNHNRNEVIIPSYTCYSVPASIEYVGLNVRICDIDINTLDYDYEKLESHNFDNVLAIVSSNLYGIPNNLTKLENLAKQKNIYFIDDAAQAMGAQFDNRFAGTFGDAGLFSLDKGKNITTINGGITITNSDEIAEKLKSYQLELVKVTVLKKIILVFKIIIYSIMLKPIFYWIPNSLPFLKLGKTIYNPEMPEFLYDKLQAALGIDLFNNLDEINSIRISNAKRIESALQKNNKIKKIEKSINCNPVYLRYPLLIENLKIKNNILNQLNDLNFSATGSYPKSIFDIHQIQTFKISSNDIPLHGRKCAESIITLPTQQYLYESDIELMVNSINKIAS